MATDPTDPLAPWPARASPPAHERPYATRERAWGRPASVVALCAILAATAIFVVLGAFALLGTGFDFWTTDSDRGAPGDADPDPDVTALGSSLLFGLLVLVAAGAALATAAGLWLRHRWAWFAALGLAAVAGVAGAILLIGGNVATALLVLAVAIVSAWLLLRRDVQEWFAISRGRLARAPRPI